MNKKHYDEILDYGLFREIHEKDIDASPLLASPEWKDFPYFTKVKTKESGILLFLSKFSSIRPNYGDVCFMNNERVMDGKFPLPTGNWIILVEAGFLTKWLRTEIVKDKKQDLILEVETTFPYGVQKGNPVFLMGKPAPDGEYKISWRKTLEVRAGKIIQT